MKVKIIKEILPFEILPEVKIGNELECDKDGGLTIFHRDSDCFHFGARQISLMISSGFLEFTFFINRLFFRKTIYYV